MIDEIFLGGRTRVAYLSIQGLCTTTVNNDSQLIMCKRSGVA
jgi:hypothetical protein